MRSSTRNILVLLSFLIPLSSPNFVFGDTPQDPCHEGAECDLELQRTFLLELIETSQDLQKQLTELNDKQDREMTVGISLAAIGTLSLAWTAIEKQINKNAVQRAAEFAYEDSKFADSEPKSSAYHSDLERSKKQLEAAMQKEARQTKIGTRIQIGGAALIVISGLATKWLQTFVQVHKTELEEMIASYEALIESLQIVIQHQEAAETIKDL